MAKKILQVAWAVDPAVLASQEGSVFFGLPHLAPVIFLPTRYSIPAPRLTGPRPWGKDLKI